MNMITVVIPNYNGMKYLKECLTSLACQAEAPGYEVLVVDNGSADGSREYMEAEFPQVRVIALEENTGFCHGVNVGIKESQTPYVVLLNNDTKADKCFLKTLYESIEGRENVFAVSASMRMWDRPELLDGAGDNYCVLGWAYSRGKGRAADGYQEACSVFSACGGAAIYRKSVFEEIGYFDELHFAYLEDLDIGYRALLHGYENRYEPGAVVLHYGSASTGSRYNEWKTRKASANSVYVVYKNMPLLQWIWNLPFLLVGFLVKFLFFSIKGMGRIYIKGLFEGLKRCFSAEGRMHKVKWKAKHLKNCFYIQWLLYRNLFLFLLKK
ncbi:MAG: glycosyltransferase family 2 protein [Lachnospiraceae bacterium]|nr:glycosyltransferase family 2 protein [Lachnospiraceae bacterium]